MRREGRYDAMKEEYAEVENRIGRDRCLKHGDRQKAAQ